MSLLTRSPLSTRASTLLPEEVDMHPALWAYFVGGYLLSIDLAEDFVCRHNIDVIDLIAQFRGAKKESFDEDQWRKVMGNVHNAYRRINNWLLDRHPDDFKSLSFPGVQTYFLYWNQTEREEWNAKRPYIGRPPKLADGWYLLFKCRDAYAEDELVNVNSIDSNEQVEARRFKDFLLSDLQVHRPQC